VAPPGGPVWWRPRNAAFAECVIDPDGVAALSRLAILEELPSPTESVGALTAPAGFYGVRSLAGRAAAASLAYRGVVLLCLNGARFIDDGGGGSPCVLTAECHLF
jgi:hypothetical protein